MLEPRLSPRTLGTPQNRVLEGRRILDLAEGVLIGLRRISAEAAFCELVAVAHRHDITVSAAAAALVEVATMPAEAHESRSFEAAIAERVWGDLPKTTSHEPV